MDQIIAGTLGIDLGSVNVKAAWLPPTRTPSEIFTTEDFLTPARGQPLAALEAMLSGSLGETIGGAPLQLSLTGVAQDLLCGRVPATCTNEVVATALAVAAAYPSARTVIDVGGQFTKWILLDGGRVADFALNGLCAAGSGAFLEQQAARLRLSADEMGKLAASARRGATVAGRCSVFAKSDMIHLQQKGTPVEEIAYGVCLALVRTFAATVLGGRRVAPPVVLVGGGGANPGLVRAFAEVLGLEATDITVPRAHSTLGARGAALSAEAVGELSLEMLRRALQDHLRGHRSTLISAGEISLAPLAPWADRKERPDEDPPRASLGAGPIPAYLGVDVGSVSTNVVVLSPEGEVLQGVYLPTRGRPIDVLDEALATIATKFGDDLEVLALGATGSGRHLVARALGADTVKNEITAQMASAARYFPEVDTVFEIGGQDSKYIGARNGRLTSFEMNKICAAGTGSFLEEQAESLGVEIRGEFAELALTAETPTDLGSRCTVFMDTELVRAQQRGVSREDICAGLAYSIARNYLEKVVAHRPLGERIVFQGGTASNEAVVAATRALTGRQIVVHPYNRISGAIGAALLAMRDHLRQARPSRFRGTDACKGAQAKSFECKRCTNRCQVIRVTIGGEVSHFGDTCERYTARDGHALTGGERQSPPDLFAKREALLQAHLPPRRPGRPRALLPRASHLLEIAPLWGHLLDALGYDVALTEPATADLISQGSQGLPNECCLPIKVMAGQIRRALTADPEALIVMPSVLELPDPARDGQTHACLYSQEVPNLLRHDAGQRLLVPQCSLSPTQGGLEEAKAELVRLLGISRREAKRALEKGFKAQARFDVARQELGQRALAQAGDKAVLVLGRPYNLHDPMLNLDLSRRLRRLGLLAIPMDLIAHDQVPLGSEHARMMWRYSRDQLRALELVRRQKNLFPLWVSCFGCGLDAFAFKHLHELIGDRPSLMLEFDEHRGEAGLVTRLEAFDDELDEHLAATPPSRPRPAPTRRPAFSGRIVVPFISDHVHVIGATFRSLGFEAEVLPPPDAATIKLGEEASSGAECHPWVVMSGELIRWATSGRGLRGDAFYYPQATNPCLIGQYGEGHRRILRKLGLDDQYLIFAFDGAGLIQRFGGHAAMRMYEGIAAVDLLMSAASARRPYELLPGAVDAAYQESIQAVCDALQAKRSTLPAMDEAFERLLAVPVRDGARGRPLVGVCGDFYTRLNPYGNADLFKRLEALGCQVWAHPYLSGLLDGGSRLNMTRWAQRGQLVPALREYITATGIETRSRPMRAAVPAELARYCLTPTPDEMRDLAAPYTGPRTNNLIAENVARIVDFIKGGADGVISAVGIGCMVGVSADGAIRRIREDHPDLPITTLAYGCSEAPSQRIKLETFVHQVHERARQRD